MSRPISIALASCNGAPYIRGQLDSLLRQTLPATEIVVCDDASSDGTLDILQTYAAQGLIRLYKNEQRLGVVMNFRRAVSLCDAQNSIALCDQDDVWLPEKLEKTDALLRAAEIKQPGPALSFSDLSLVDARLQPLAPSFWKILRIEPARESLRSLLFGNFITGCTVLMNPEMSALFCEMPGKGVTMHDAWLGLIAFCFGTYEYTGEPLVLYRQHDGNVTGETNKAESLRQKAAGNLVQLRNNKNYLLPNTEMAALFLKRYQARLSPLQVEQLYGFGRLREATWFSKKLLSLAARSYRWRTLSKLH